MRISSAGYSHAHDSSFVISRPNGIDSWLLLLVKTPSLFVIDGEEVSAKANSFVLFEAGVPQHYRSSGGEYIDDWLHFYPDDNEEDAIRRLAIPLNKIIHLGDLSELSSHIRAIVSEMYSQERLSEEISLLQLQILLKKLSRALDSDRRRTEGSASVYYERMRRLRDDIYTNPRQERTVDGLSAQLSMSRSGFQHTYKQLFGTSVTTDIISARLQRVKYYLSTTDMPLSMIAEQCGYNSEIHLMRQFKSRSGVTPTEYRREMKA